MLYIRLAFGFFHNFICISCILFLFFIFIYFIYYGGEKSGEEENWTRMIFFFHHKWECNIYSIYIIKHPTIFSTNYLDALYSSLTFGFFRNFTSFYEFPFFASYFFYFYIYSFILFITFGIFSWLSYHQIPIFTSYYLE